MAKDRVRGDWYGVVLMNMGGPGSLEEVRPYMQRVLSDPHLVRLPGGAVYQGTFARLVSRRREGRVRERYAQIGGRSPLLEATRELAAKLEARLGAPVAVAMRYSEPGAGDAVRELRGRGVRALVGLSLYPQYSTSTTSSSVDDLRSQVPTGLELVTVERHHLAPGFVQALAESVERGLAQVGAGDDLHLLFTAHSIPLSYTRAGDPYVAEVEQTVAAVVERLGEGARPPAHSLAFQSAMRFGRWHGPSLDEELERLLAQGVRRLLVQPVTFVSENLETLYDLDVSFRKTARARGIERFLRLPAPGASEAYQGALARLVREALPSLEVSHG